MSYIDCKSNIELVKNKKRWENDQVEFWKEEEYGWCSKEKGQTWEYGYDTLKDAVVSYAMSIAKVEDSIKTTGSMLINKNYIQENAWNKNDTNKKVSVINCEVVVRRFTA
ncbi:hypothetical protein SAMN04487895_101711 [Paenibacillus sophorae]|uniref:Uncharacterized protein n=1 Tax=Paenibacillus sophorae TaxID=1333845 RepID=A0A1H8H0M4_9BACL|nr:hypothetical protein [Paenibacillus sophorae]QWU14402.1 hypothetical protein KP014_21070 [Paenibacillus sophorae]SEN49685.1 hypothetical protein SAMN04487895_101711 [Paenibacillus sophorae]